MKSFFALYVKELKANKTRFLFLLLLIAGLNAYGLIRIENLELKTWSVLAAAFTLVLSLPFLLAHAFNSEWKSETHYQMFALPVPQYIVILAKIAAVVSRGIVGGIIVISCLYLWLISTAAGDIRLSFFGREVTGVPTFFDFGLVAGLILVTYMVFILGVVTGMEGVKFAVKRYRRLVAVAFFIFAVFVYGWLLPQDDWFPLVYTILMGVFFMILGLVMYEKRAEI